MEKILKIKKYDTFNRIGYRMQTTKQFIYFTINTYRHRNEEWGCLLSEEDYKKYIGTKLLDIVLVDKPLEHAEGYKGFTACFNIETSLGTLQFIGYNKHNGYYVHEVKVTSEKWNFSEII